MPAPPASSSRSVPGVATTSAGIAWSCEGRRRGSTATRCSSTSPHRGRGRRPGDRGSRSWLRRHPARSVARSRAPVELGAVGANLEDAGRPTLPDRRGRRPHRRPAWRPRRVCAGCPHRHLLRWDKRGRVRRDRRTRGSLRRSGRRLHLRAGRRRSDTIRRLATAIPGPFNVVAGLANTIDAPTLSGWVSNGSASVAAWPEPR